MFFKLTFSALHGTPARTSDEKGVRLSVCPPVCQTRALLQKGKKIVQIFTPYE